ncbi:ArsR family transcriptional regulator [Lunatibacter salilacus]|uniref:ArsR family transcriptional regulator n=1 Tax=Lunatibacter salilacus TaxID=2483804 RepID=UPI0018FE362B
MGYSVRIQILKILSEQSCCFTGDLTEIIPLAQSTISQHLKSLKDIEPRNLERRRKWKPWAELRHIPLIMRGSWL